MDVMKKKQMLATLVMLSLLQGSVYAEIHEIPEVGKRYDDYLYYDADGSKRFSLQNSVKGEQHNYYFNEGATLDASNGGKHAAILAHNWGGFNTDTAEIFHIGKGKEFVVKSYENGRGTLIAEEGATLSVVGGNVILESGIKSTSNMDNTDSSIHMESSGVLKIDAESMWMGNKRTEDRHNVGAISMAGDSNTVDIDVTGTFTAENVDMGIALQTQGDGTYALADIHTGEDISITAQRSDGHAASGYRGAGIYSLSYYHANSSSTVNFISDNGNITVNAQGYALYAYGNTPTVLQANNGKITLHSEEKHGIYSKGYFDENKNTTELSAKEIEISGAEYGVRSDNAVIKTTVTDNLTISADDGWSVCLLSGSKAYFKANKTTYNKDIYVKGSEFNAFANKNEVNGQVRVLDGGTATFASANEEAAGTATINHTTSDAVTATSDEEKASEIIFKQATFINSQGDEVYHADKQGVRTNSAIRANRNSVITLDNAAGVYGDIIAGRGISGSDAKGGQITINSVDYADFKGDVLAGNSGKIDITLNNKANYEGRVDDYFQASLDNVFRPDEFHDEDGKNVNVEEAGQINLTLNDSQWTARGQNFVSELTLNNGTVDMTSDKRSSVTVNNLSGNGTIKMNLDAESRENGDMLYVLGSHAGEQTIVVNWLNEDGVNAIAEGERIRFATTDGNVGAFKAQTRDAGFFNLAYLTDTDPYDTVNETEENLDYNGVTVEGADNGTDKPGNKFVNETFDNGGINHYIVGIDKSQSEVSDTGKTIINMSRANYSNAIYMDRLNKRLGEARYINAEDGEGMWVRIRHDRIGKTDAYRSQNTMYELGYDVKQECDNGERRVGMAGDYMHGDTGYSDIAGKGEIDRYGLWLYDTWMGNKGHYVDYVAKWGHLSNDFELYTMSRGEKVTGDYSNNVFSISAEYGRKKDLGGDWYIEPQAQLQLARVSGAEYNTSQHTEVSVDGINSLIGRAGFRLGKDFGEDKRSTVYIKADVLHEFLGDQDIYVRDETTNGHWAGISYENEGTWYDVGFGFATAVGKNSYAFMDFEKSFGHDNDETYQINVGMQWSF